jgi:hypothetical protein
LVSRQSSPRTHRRTGPWLPHRAEVRSFVADDLPVDVVAVHHETVSVDGSGLRPHQHLVDEVIRVQNWLRRSSVRQDRLARPGGESLGRPTVDGKGVAVGDEFVAGCSVRRGSWCDLYELGGLVVEPAVARSTTASGRCRILPVMDIRRRIELNSGCGQLLLHLAEVFNQHDEADHQACDSSEY